MIEKDTRCQPLVSKYTCTHTTMYTQMHTQIKTKKNCCLSIVKAENLRHNHFFLTPEVLTRQMLPYVLHCSIVTIKIFSELVPRNPHKKTKEH